MTLALPQPSVYRQFSMGTSPAHQSPRDIRNYSVLVRFLLVVGLLGLLAALLTVLVAIVTSSSLLLLLTIAAGIGGVAFMLLGLAGQAAKREDPTTSGEDWGSFDTWDWDDAGGFYDGLVRSTEPANDEGSRFRIFVDPASGS